MTERVRRAGDGHGTEGPRGVGARPEDGGSPPRKEGFGAAPLTVRASCEGQAIIETALILPILVLLLIGIFDLGRAVWLSNTLATAVREGSRYGVVHGAQSGSPTGPGSATYTPPNVDTAITSAVQQYATGVPNMTVNATWPDGNANRGSRIVVAASFPFTPLISQAFIGDALSVTIQSSSTLVIEQ